MGLFNEVYLPCPECGELASLQISEVVKTSGGLRLDDPAVMARLTEERREHLFWRVEGEHFYCEGEHGCGHAFLPVTEGFSERMRDIASALTDSERRILASIARGGRR